MILFILVELLNKVAGVFITGSLARVLSTAQFSGYVASTVALGYAIEIGFFGAQNRHNAEYALDGQYLSSGSFAARRTLSVITSLLAMGFLAAALRASAQGLVTLPLLLTVLFVPMTFDFVAYGARRPNIVVGVRFLAQSAMVGWIALVGYGAIPASQVFWGQLIQTSLLAVGLIVVLGRVGLLRPFHVQMGLFSFPFSKSELVTTFRGQIAAFALRLLSLLLVSGDFLFITTFGSNAAIDVGLGLRFVQVLFPFVVFYVDSRVKDISAGNLERYALALSAICIMLLPAAPIATVVLFGRGYANRTFDVAGLVAALAVQGLVQFSVMLSLKTKTELVLLRRFAVPLAVGGAATAVATFEGWSADVFTAIYVVKAMLFTVQVPSLTTKARVCMCVTLASLPLLNACLDAIGYYGAVGSYVASIMPF